VELKKMYAVPELRGRGLGRVVEARLEKHAADHGARRAILETGAHSHGALALVRLAGYQPTPATSRAATPPSTGPSPRISPGSAGRPTGVTCAPPFDELSLLARIDGVPDEALVSHRSAT